MKIWLGVRSGTVRAYENPPVGLPWLHDGISTRALSKAWSKLDLICLGKTAVKLQSLYHHTDPVR